MSSARLHCVEAGSADAPVLVLLHGFGGHAAGWQPVIAMLDKKFRILAFDLPGHAGSLFYPGFGSPRTAAFAVIEELRLRDIGKAHVAGHSMGGAVAVLMALESPDIIASLTLVAPGGFGPELDIPTMKGFAAAKIGEEIEAALMPMVARPDTLEKTLLENLAAMRARPGQQEALAHVLAKITRGDGQGVLPLDRLQPGFCPVTLVWGKQDRTVPFSQSANAPAWFGLAAVEGAGHMLIEEAPHAVARAIVEQLQTI